MRMPRPRWPLLALCAVLFLLTGCSHAVAGTPKAAPPPGVAVSADGFGIRVGLADAAVQLEIFVEPQCPACAAFEADYGPDFRSKLAMGALAITYRPVTFLDLDKADGYSATVANTLFLAGTGADVTAVGFQLYLEGLMDNQDVAGDDYRNSDFADIAREAGLPDAVVARIGSGAGGVDVATMSKQNREALIAATGATPTVINQATGKVIDIDDDDWFDRLFTHAVT
ncbi:protein disulfide-isomerase [Mycolicibacterium insubricum]|jgi:protein-disulfide isomerase|uniref:Uncharacterized protein n=1 Tax=Mycolicibacterium insubricum TaxID=444597 RepID=A0A1X0CY62_9MYCO|nr:thioredoxin domain-containing protein [Mycolicibacterium insubricum]MCB9440801.1 thioredoxin domain-containing protein [Mycolicibacterium sp.]MCV7080017.1 thioredoxin domain-containing protein [Mycolicibacterium insubricum]ORA65018.1 hypothetical protein BST26_19355 [Mycolicibacterium insubricum]BBZ65747.1 protein disulfide-isomerase [Mycolicibacterium insubricum]